MPEYPELFVLRHGQTQWNVEGRYQGRKDSPLTALGLAQAGAQARILAASFAGRHVPSFISPQGRAVQTAKIALAGLSPAPVKDTRLMEIDFGSWEGQTRLDIEATFPDTVRDGQPLSWYFQAPAGERFVDISERVRRFLDQLQGPSIEVTHGVTSMVLRGLWLGYSEAELLCLPHQQGCVYHLNNGEESCLTA